jgi:hypothetical protein
MKVINASQIAETVERLCIEATVSLTVTYWRLLKRA